MVSRHVDDARAVLGLAEKRPYDVAVCLGPEDVPSHAADVNHITHQEERFDLHALEQLQQQVRPAAPSAEMNIRNERAPQSQRGHVTHAAPYIEERTDDELEAAALHGLEIQATISLQRERLRKLVHIKTQESAATRFLVTFSSLPPQFSSGSARTRSPASAESDR